MQAGCEISLVLGITDMPDTVAKGRLGGMISEKEMISGCCLKEKEQFVQRKIAVGKAMAKVHHGDSLAKVSRSHRFIRCSQLLYTVFA